MSLETPEAPQQGPPVRTNPKADAKAAKAYAKATRPWYKKKRFMLPLGLVLLMVAVSAGSSGSGDNNGTGGTSGASNNDGGAGASAATSDTKAGNSSQTFSPSEGDGADESPSEDGPTFENGVLTTPDLKIQITRYKVIKAGQKGNEYGEKPVIAFWYKTTNLSGAKVDPTDFLFNFTVYQDNDPNVVNELDLGYGTDLGSSNHDPLEKIKKGGTVEDTMAYELDDLVTPVKLVATDGVAGDVIGKATYKLR